ncbi:hypothetical protein FF38_07845 [Lucilia cuprina]|uniref:Uncharacterized protein n=1 Tax=Lucilia cuprina TaxID=7375 RepID=A0A0L0BXU6_LUCCU|nr:hypothetical protein FF38_07845 [Lucilia cuprina]
MDLQNVLLSVGIILLALTICNGNTIKPLDKAPIIGVRLPVTVPVYVAQQPVNTGSAVYPYYYYYPQSQYPNTGVVYQPSLTGVQYPYYGWSNTPTYKPAIPTAPTDTTGGGAGDSHDPKKDVEYIY